MQGYVVIANGPRAGERVELSSDRPFRFGSNPDCDYVCASSGLEDTHFQISRRGRFAVVSDLNNASSTRVNGHRIGTHILHNFDEIAAGGLRLRYVSKDESLDRALELDSGRQPSLNADSGRRKADGILVADAGLSGRILDASTYLPPANYETISTAIRAVEPEQGIGHLRTALDAIYRVSNFLLSDDNHDSVISKVMDVVNDSVKPDRAFFLGWDAAGKRIQTLKNCNGSVSVITPERERAATDMVRQCIEHGTPLLANVDENDANDLRARSAMCVPVRSATRRIGAIYVDQISNQRAFNASELELLAAVGRQAGLALERLRIYEDMENLFYSCVRALVTAIEAKDVYTHGHSERVAAYSLSIAEELGLDEHLMDAVRLGALLHDVGKIGVPESILFKPGKLTDDEFEIIKTHPARGAEILGHIGDIPDVIAAVRSHHERFDGLGYPDAMSGEDIPMAARIVAVSDAFDAMTSNRSYRRNLTTEDAIEEFQRCSGTQFAPDVCEAMVYLLRQGVIVPSSDLHRAGVDLSTMVYNRPAASA